MTEVVEYVQVEEDDLDIANRIAHDLTVEQFAALKVADRDTALFALLREVAESQRSLEMRLDTWENEVRSKLGALSDPVARAKMIQEIMGELTGGLLSGGGLMGLGGRR